MMKPNLKQAVMQTVPTTKSAQLRDVMPDIENRLAAGVQLVAIHQALINAGLALTFQTLKTYLYRYRKKQQGKSQNQPAIPVGQSGTSAQLQAAPASLETETLHGQISMQELDRLMKPDPVDQAEKLARYERLAKQQRRSAR